MVELRPFPFPALVRRMFRELDERGSIFDLPRAKFVLDGRGRDLSVGFHGARASTPFGPAAGPQSQMAQNLVLSWLGGARILELKTVQVNDQLVIPRPCIDMQTVGYNVEWSQELNLAESLEEYVKGAMLIELLVASGRLPLAPDFTQTIYDMSVGYDLAGLRSGPVQDFLRGMRNCGAVVERLRARLPVELGSLRQLDFSRQLSSTLTLSTFHGCPPDEIERMLEFLQDEHQLHCVVKLNPMLLGPEAMRELLWERLGYEDVHVPATAFERDTRWPQMEGFVERLGARAERLGLGFGVKFTNTLIVENRRDFFPAEEREMYLSGPPLHVLAMELVRRFRARFGDRYPISFSAGVDRKNFPDAVALGLVPITVCSDLLKAGGYARSHGYFDELERRMGAVDANSIDEFVLRAHAGSEQPAQTLADARLANTEAYVAALVEDPRYALAANARAPRKIDSQLELLDCISCDKCVPVCPNDANFTFVLPRLEVPIIKLRRHGTAWERRADGVLRVEEKHQLASFADFCNHCGNCDVFCPEDGGPYLVKPCFFGNRADFEAFDELDGFHFEYLDGGADADVLHGRFQGRVLRLETRGATEVYAGPDFTLTFVGSGSGDADGLDGARSAADGEVDLTFLFLLRWIRAAVFEENGLSYPALVAAPSP